MWQIESVRDGYKLSTEGRSPNPNNPYTVWWPSLRHHANGTTWDSTLTKKEILEKLEKKL